MNEDLDIAVLKKRARAGDSSALQELRDRGFFKKKKVTQTSFPLSHGQRRLWVLDRLSDAGAAYSMPAAARLRGALSIESLRQAIRLLVARHETLRTRFVMEDGKPRQRIETDGTPDLVERDFSGADGFQLALQWIREDAGRPFDLEEDKPVRFAILRLGPDDHLFYYNLHHIVGDEWSLDILARDLAVAYAGVEGGQNEPLAPLANQYRHYVAHQEAELAGDRVADHRNYWHGRFAGTVPSLDLKTDFPRPAVKQFRGKAIERQWKPELVDGLKTLGTEAQATPFICAVALVEVLLFRYTGQTDFVIGAPISGRDQPGVADQIGFFVNTLPLRLEPGPTARFAEVLEQARRECLNAFAHQIYPFDRLVDELGLARDMSRNPLFDVALAYQRVDGSGDSEPGIEMTPVELEVSPARFDLTFIFREDENGLSVRIEFDADLFESSSVERMSAHLERLARSVVAQSGLRISDHNLLPEDERSALLDRFSAGVQAAWSPDNVVDLIARHASLRPNAAALEDTQGNVLTYGELNRRADQLADALREKGVAAESVVALAMRPGFDTVVGILGILKAGGVYLPLDPGFPPSRLEFMFRNSGAMLALVDPETEMAQLPVPSMRVADCVERAGGARSNPMPVRQPDQLAYIIYTSGSTGQPKGAGLTDRGLQNLCLDQGQRLALGPEARMLQFASLCFDASIWEVFSTLVSGATLILADRDEKMPGKPLAKLCAERRVTHLLLPPSAVAQMPEGSLADCTHMVVGGEACRREILEQWSNGRVLINAYGPTEATVIATMSEALSAESSCAIGHPLSNFTVYLLDSRMRPAPLGTAAEIYIGGPGLARGYVNSPGLTAARFVPHPFAEGQRLYRSGDLGRHLADGSIEFLGRCDFQVKHRGFRIELGEIEARLGEYPGVIDAAVLLREDAGADPLLVAYPVFDAGSEPPDAMALRAFLRDRLPAYCIPDRFHPLAEPPRTSSGKLDRRRLPAPRLDRTSTPGSHREPRNDIERKLCAIWSESLDVERVGIDDDFFELGGNSLKAIQIVTRIERDLGLELRVRDVFQSPSVRELAGLAPAAKLATKAEPIPACALANDYEASHAQRRLWVLERLAAAHAAYNLNFGFRIRGSLDLAALEAAFQDVVDRHESLRTVFFERHGEPRQVVLDQMKAPFETRQGSPDDVADWLARWLERPFDLENGPLLRVSVLELGPQEAALLAQLHHIVGDGWSLEILIAEALANYESRRQGQPPGRGPLRVQYKDFAAWQNNLLRGLEAEIHRDYWLDQLGGELPVLELPTDHPRPALQSFTGATLRGRLDPDLAGDLRAQAREHSTSLYVVVLSATKALLARYSGQSDLIVGSPVAGREHVDTEGMIGFFANMLALRSSVDGASTFSDLLEQVKHTVQGAFDHQVYPFDRIVEELDVPRRMSRSPIFDVVVSLQNLGRDVGSSEDLEIEPLGADSSSSKFDLTFFFYEEADGSVEVAIEYCTALFSAERIQRMLAHLETLVRQIVEHPDGRLNRFSLLSESERRQLTHEWGGTRAQYPFDRTVPELFAEQATAHPDAVAVVCGDDRLTYRGLADRASELAAGLRAADLAQPGEFVGIMAERTLKLPIALLAILKCGCAYVPLDREWPTARHREIAEDLRMRTILCQESIPGELVEGCRYPVMDEVSAPGANTEAIGDAMAAAYTMFTSGSTGRPKGVTTPHRAIVRLVKNTDYVDLSEEEVFLQMAPVSFDASTLELWGCLLNGGRLVMMPARTPSLDEIAGAVQKHGVSTLWLTAGLFHLMVDERLEGLRGVRQLLAGGDVLSEGHVRKVLEELPECEVINGYGPTENTTFTTCHNTRKAGWKGGPVPLGRPIANTQVYVVDGDLNLQPPGINGELLTGGDGLALGYQGRPGMTAERFVPDPFSGAPGARLYRTGDLVRWGAEGRLEFIGRTDHQVKIRGFRVEPGEIECHLTAHAGVTSAFVMARRNESGGRELAAYYTGEQPPDESELKQFLGERLPDYMVPARMTPLAALPLNANGKVDRSRLPAPGPAKRVHEQFNTPEERVLARVWREALSINEVGATDNFFELGGDSIRAIQIASRLRPLGYQLEVSALLRFPILREAASHLQQEGDTEKREAVSGQAPLLPIQQWFFDCYGGQDEWRHFNQSVVVRTDERVDAAALKRAIAFLQRHHDGLRTTFHFVDGEARQRVHETDFPVEIVEVDLRDSNDVEADVAARANATQCGMEPEIGPLLKTVLFHLPKGDQLLLAAHHLIVDGVSWRILLEDLARLMAQAKSGDELDLGGKSDSGLAWAAFLQDHAQSESLLAQRDYWREVAAQADPPLPGELADSEAANVGRVSRTIEFDEAATADLSTHALRRYHTQLNELLLAAAGLALCSWRDLSACLVAVEGHGREVDEAGAELDLGRTVGWFTSMFPLRLQGDESDLGSQIKETKESLRGIPGKGLGFGLLRQRDSGLKSCHPRVSCNYLGRFDEDEAEGLTAGNLDGGREINPLLRHPATMDIVAIVRQGRLSFTAHHSPDRLPTESVDRFLSALQSAVNRVLAHCLARDVSEKTPADFTWTPFDLGAYANFLERHSWRPEEIEDIYPLAPMQEGFLFQKELDEDGEAYFIQLGYRLQGSLDVEALQECWRRLSERFEVFRTAFVQTGVGQPLQVVLRRREPEIRVEDWRHKSAAEQQADLEVWLREDRRRGFDFVRDPLSRLTIFEFGPKRYHLVWSTHHLALDGWCLGIVFSSLADDYRGLIQGAASEVVPGPRYSAFVRWLLQRPPEASVGFWQGYLRGYETLASVPTSASTTPSADADYRELEFRWDARQSEQIRSLCRRQRVTVNTFFQAVWALLLARYNDVVDVVFGTVVSGRPAELEHMGEIVGLFINTVPLRVRVDEGERFAEYLQKVQAAFVESDGHRHLPLAEIQAQSELGNGLFDHVLTFESYPEGPRLEGAEPGAREELEFQLETKFDRTHYPFGIVVMPGEEIVGSFGYDTGRHDEAQVRRIWSHLLTVVEQAVRNPRICVDEVTLLPTEEHRLVDSVFANGPTVKRTPPNVVEWFRSVAGRCPDEEAIVGEHHRLTYRETDEASTRVAQALLRQFTLPADSRVGIFMPRSVWLPIAVLGVLKAGAAYVPMDVDYPADRNLGILNDAQCVAVLTDGSSDPDFGCPALPVNELARQPGNETLPSIAPASLAYVIYTSGSTGRPKGCQLEHRNLSHYLHWANDYYFDNAGQGSFPLFTSIAFDLTVTSLFLPLLRGRILRVFAREAEVADVLHECLRPGSEIDAIKLTPSHASLIQNLDLQESSLRLAILGGEALSKEQVASLHRLNPAMVVVNEYGPTEATVGCVVKTVLPDEEQILIGKPIQNTTVKILDRHRRPVPIGVSGEMWLGGTGVARGYLKRDELNEACFVTGLDGGDERFYRSGDLARWRPDGDLQLIGRCDDQVKIRGHRVELGELENVLANQASVHEAAVVPRRLTGEELELVAYVVAEAGTDASVLRSHLIQRVPEAWLPRHIVFLDQLPLTVNGKVDRAALPLPDEADGDRTAERTLARDRTELEIAGIFGEVLGLEEIGVTEDFFLLGGHSLKAMQAALLIHQQLGVRIAMREFFELRTVERLARAVRSRRGSAYDEIRPVEQREHYPLSHAQKRLWLLHQFEGAEIAYNMPKAFRLDGPLDPAALRGAFADLLERHEVLRTGIDLIAGEPRQFVHAELTMDLVELDLSGERDAEAATLRRAEQEALKPFDLRQPPLLRGVLIDQGEDRHVIVLVLHHIIADGWSTNVLYRELATLYEARRLERSHGLTPLRIQYRDYAVWQNERGFDVEEAYWLERMANFGGPLALPYDYPAGRECDFSGATVTRVLDAEASQRIRRYAAANGTTESNVIFALYVLFLFQLTRQADLCVGMSIANRTNRDLERLIGFFVNILPIRVRCRDSMEFQDLLAEVNRIVLEAFDHQDYPFDLLVQNVNPDRARSQRPLLNVIYGFQNYDDVRLELPGTDDPGGEQEASGELAAAAQFDIKFDTAKFDLTLFVTDVRDAFRLDLEFDSRLFSAETTSGYLRAMERFAEMI